MGTLSPWKYADQEDTNINGSMVWAPLTTNEFADGWDIEDWQMFSLFWLRTNKTCPSFRTHPDVGNCHITNSAYKCLKIVLLGGILTATTYLPTFLPSYPQPASGSAGGIHTCTNSACNMWVLLKGSCGVKNSMLFLKSSVTHIISTRFLVRPIIYIIVCYSRHLPWVFVP